MSPERGKLPIRRWAITMESENRVITRPHIPGGPERICPIINRILALSKNGTRAILERVLADFSLRHRNFKQIIKRNYDRIKEHVPDGANISDERQLLMGAYFTMEYSIESAALFNPSIVPHPIQDDSSEGALKFVMSFRATGEGHISSIVFRSGTIEKNNEIYFDPLSHFVGTGEVHANPSYETHLFGLKLVEMGACNAVTNYVLSELGPEFTLGQFREKIAELETAKQFPEIDRLEAIEHASWLAESNYILTFPAEHRISERVIFPVTLNESMGLEDARFVRFVDDNGAVTYYATLTAYNGFVLLPQLIETKDFVTYKMITLNGEAVRNKGMALFPRRIGGKFVMLSRLDGENNYVMFSKNLHFWQQADALMEPKRSWEFVQIGNCGSPIETDSGWLVLTHGVGAMRKYSIGVVLLDLDDPRKVIGRIEEPLLSPNEYEREGYVPNVVYTCGAMIHSGELIIPYAMGDQRCSIATVPVTDLLDRLEAK